MTKKFKSDEIGNIGLEVAILRNCLMLMQDSLREKEKKILLSASKLVKTAIK